ncbi:MAG: transcription elongation factor GreA [Candidatus Brocadiales bacterium]
MKRIPVTLEGKKQLEEELNHLKDVERPKIEKTIGEARAHGDLRENAEYHAAKEAQGLLEAKIRLIEHKLAHSYVINPARIPRDTVAITARVTMKDMDSGEMEKYHLVGEGEADPDNGKILVTSPLAQGIIGRQVGDQVSIKAPMGTLRYEIVSIEYQAP